MFLMPKLDIKLTKNLKIQQRVQIKVEIHQEVQTKVEIARYRPNYDCKVQVTFLNCQLESKLKLKLIQRVQIKVESIKIKFAQVCGVV